MGTMSVTAADNAAPKAGVEGAIAQASARTGTNFDFLLAQARIESGLDSKARAPTSSATGLFQFIESTWLETMHRHGRAHGLGDLAQSIEMTKGGARVADPLLRGRILALRNDPNIASLMAGELASDNSAKLQAVLGRAPDASELYLAHFMGASGAQSFLSTLASNPAASAATQFPAAAKANRGIFYSQGGEPRSVSEVMQLLRGKVARAMAEGDPLKSAAVAATGDPFSPQHWTVAPTSRAMARATPSAGSASSRPLPVSAILEQSFSLGSAIDGAANRAANHARRAYEQLKAVGL